jgi:lipocalin
MGASPSKSVMDHIMDLTLSEQQKYFSGTWHEQGRLYTIFERNCRGVKAHYSTTEKGDVHVVNECLWENELYKMEGKATRMFPDTDLAAFYIEFPFVPRGGYFIIYAENIDKSNGIALVAGRYFSFFWILTRKKCYDKQRVCHILKQLKLPMDHDKLIWNDGEKCFDS